METGVETKWNGDWSRGCTFEALVANRIIDDAKDRLLLVGQADGDGNLAAWFEWAAKDGWVGNIAGAAAGS